MLGIWSLCESLFDDLSEVQFSLLGILNLKSMLDHS